MAAQARRRIPELDGFRVLLVFIVSWYHIWQQSWLTPHVGSVSLDFLVRAGYMPVDGTILLSGFLLFLPHARSMLLGEKTPSARGFYRRRVMRIVPSYYFITLLMLFAVAIPQRQYASVGSLLRDLVMHLTFTFPFDKTVYYATRLGGASWTIAIEMQMYLLFPLVARLARKAPAATMLGMMAAAAYVRLGFLHTMSEYSMVVNQLVSFLDVYAIGMACALLYVFLAQRWAAWPHRRLREAAATLLLALGIWGFVLILQRQAYTSFDYNMIQAGQLLRRPLLAGALGLVMTSLPFCLRPVRWLFGNRMMGWLAGISMNYYLLHQSVAVELKRLGIPPAVSAQPHVDGERAWQVPYVWLCFGISLALAALVTYLVEKPCARLLQSAFARRDAEKS